MQVTEPLAENVQNSFKSLIEVRLGAREHLFVRVEALHPPTEPKHGPGVFHKRELHRAPEPAGLRAVDGNDGHLQGSVQQIFGKGKDTTCEAEGFTWAQDGVSLPQTPSND